MLVVTRGPTASSATTSTSPRFRNLPAVREQHGFGRLQLLKLCGGVRIVRVLVWVHFQRELAERFVDEFVCQLYVFQQAEQLSSHSFRWQSVRRRWRSIVVLLVTTHCYLFAVSGRQLDR